MINVSDFINRILNDGGVSVSPVNGQSPAGGYMVAIIGREQSMPVDLPVLVLGNLVLRYILDNWSILEQDGNYFGAWVDGGRLVLDCSRNFSDLSHAMEAGRLALQDAIWDVENGREIRLK